MRNVNTPLIHQLRHLNRQIKTDNAHHTNESMHILLQLLTLMLASGTVHLREVMSIGPALYIVDLGAGSKWNQMIKAVS